MSEFDIPGTTPALHAWRAQHSETWLYYDAFERTIAGLLLTGRLPPGEWEQGHSVFYTPTAKTDFTVQWYARGLTLQEFSARVKSVTNSLGIEPTSVTATHWISSPDQVPDLIAEWSLDVGARKLAIVVKGFAPKGCKIDPRYQPNEPVTTIYAKLHPECIAVLEELKG